MQSRLRVVYRSNSHAPFWLVADKSGMWGKNGLGVDTSPQLVREKAVDSLKSGHVDLISGNHHNLYARNAKNQEDFVHLAQVANNWTENRMVVADGIRGTPDLRGKKVAFNPDPTKRIKSYAILHCMQYQWPAYWSYCFNHTGGELLIRSQNNRSPRSDTHQGRFLRPINVGSGLISRLRMPASIFGSFSCRRVWT